MERIVLNLEDMDSPIRLDLFLATELPNLSRSYIQKLIKEGHVKINGVQITSKKEKVKENDNIELFIPEPKMLEVKPQNIPLDIVYEDDDVIVVNKPQGMVVHPAVGNYENTLVNALLYHCKNLSSINGIIRPGIIHRIDKDTSGLLMVAKNNEAHNFLSEQLKNHTIKRIYYAIVNGVIKEDRGTINAPIGRHPVNRLKMAVVERNGKEAITHYEVLKRYKNHTLLMLRLETGRTHQIRVHMSYIGYPVLGDPLYGKRKEKISMNGQALHAKIIGFIHPRTRDYMEFDSELPDYFKEALKKIE